MSKAPIFNPILGWVPVTFILFSFYEASKEWFSTWMKGIISWKTKGKDYRWIKYTEGYIFTYSKPEASLYPVSFPRCVSLRWRFFLLQIPQGASSLCGGGLPAYWTISTQIHTSNISLVLTFLLFPLKLLNVSYLNFRFFKTELNVLPLK